MEDGAEMHAENRQQGELMRSVGMDSDIGRVCAWIQRDPCKAFGINMFFSCCRSSIIQSSLEISEVTYSF